MFIQVFLPLSPLSTRPHDRFNTNKTLNLIGPCHYVIILPTNSFLLNLYKLMLKIAKENEFKWIKGGLIKENGDILMVKNSREI